MPDITKKKQTTTGTGSARKKALEETKKRLEAKKSIAEAFEADGYTPDKPNTYVRDTKVGTTPIIGAGQYADSTGKRNQFSFSEQQRRANERTARTNYMTAAQQKAASTADKTVPSMAFQMLRQMLGKPTTFAQSGSARKDINQWYGDNTRTNNGFQSFSKPDTLYKARQTPLIVPEVLTENERKAREGYLSPTAKTDAFGNLIDKRTDINSLRESVSAPIQTREEDQKQNKAADYMDERALAAQQEAAIKKAQAGRSPEEQIVRFLGGTGRAAQNSIYNYGNNILNSIDALNHKTDQMYGMSGTKIERDKLDKAFKNISERAQQDIDSGNISTAWAQTVDTGVRMAIDSLVMAAGAGVMGGAATSANTGSRLVNTVLDAVQNPAFYTSYVQEFGSDYADYVNNGVDEDKAVLIAGTIALLNSYVEVQGGSEKMINKLTDKIFKKVPMNAPMQLVKEKLSEAIEESFEELVQAPIGNLGIRMAYDPNKEIFDLNEMVSNGWSAFISSLMLGGITTGIEYGVNQKWKSQDISSQYAYIGQQVKKDNGTLSDLLSQAETSNNVNARFQSYTIQQTLANGESPSDYKVGQLAATMAENEQIEAERQKIVGERQAKQEQKRQKKNQSQQTEETPVQQETDRVISAPLDEEVMPESGTETATATNPETVPQTARADENTASIQAIQEPETQTASEELAAVTPSVATSVATPERRQAAQEQPLEISAREMNSYGENGQRALRAGLTRAAQNGESQTAYKNAFTAYYKWGTWGKDISQIDSAFSGSISQSAAYAAYMSGVNDNAAIVARNTANQRKATGTGGLMQGTHNSKVDANTRNYLDALGRAFRVSIAIDDEGSGYNGMLDKNGVVHIAADTTRPAAGVLNHELTHVLRSRSESDYQTYKNVVAAFINKESEGAFEQRVEELIDLYAENGQTLTRDDAEEEIVANASERFLTDKESVDLMVKQNRGVAKKILDGIRSIINKLKGVIRDKSIHNKEARILSRDLETFQRAERVWVSALSQSTGDESVKAEGIASSRDNSEAFENENVTVLPGADVVDDGNEVKYNLQTFGEAERNKYIRGLVENKVITESEAAELRRNLDNLVEIIDANREILDYTSSAVDTDSDGNVVTDNRKFSPVKPNSDPLYKVSVDFSTLCRKRVLQQAIVEQIQSRLGKALTKEEQLAIRKELVSMRAEGAKIDVACGLCYVEARRLLAGKQIQNFLDNPEKVFADQLGKKNPVVNNMVKAEQNKMIAAFNTENGTEYKSLREISKAGRKDVAADIRTAKRAILQKYSTSGNEELSQIREKGVRMAKENPEMFLMVENLSKLRESDPLIYDAFTAFVRNATKSKAQEPRVPWIYGDSQIVSDKLAEAMNRENGIRSQSWSDFEIVNILDYMQAVMELSERGMKLQTYTKVPDFVDLMGKTGAMVNLSMIAKGRNGLAVNGELDFDQLEGMKVSDMTRLRKKYADTAGSILVGVNDDHIIKAMQSDDIDYVIPYHASGMSEDMRRRAGILGWESYESYQEEKYVGGKKEGGRPKAPKFSEWGIPKPEDDTSNGLDLMRTMADRYLQLCYERGYTPKFPQFLSRDENGLYHTIPGTSDNYWKLLIDRKMVSTESGKIDGHYIRQNALKPIFDFGEVKRMLTDALGDTRLQANAEAARKVVYKYLHGGIDATEETLDAVKNMNDQMIDQAVEAVSKNLKSNKYQLREDEPDSKLFSRKEFGEIAKDDVVQEIISDMEYENYGIRIQEEDTESVGKVMEHTSSNFGGDFDSEELSDIAGSLDGVSAIDVHNVRRLAEFGGYEGKVAYLLGSDDSDIGYDGGEIIMKDPVVLAKLEYRNGKLVVSESTNSDEKLQLREDNPYDWLDDGDEDYPDEDTAPTPGDEDAPPEAVVKEGLGENWLDRQVDRTISSNENVESTIAAIRAEGRAFKDVKPGAVDQVVKAAAKQYGATDTKQLNAAVHGALDYLARHGEEGTGSAIASVYQAVKETLSKTESVDRTMYDETKGMRDYLKTTRIYVPDSVKSDITDYNDFRKSLFGKVRIVNDPTAMHIDQAYAELSAQYPGLLSSEIINPSAQLQEIADTLDAAQPVIVASYGEDGQTSFVGNINEASIDMTTDILHSLVQTAITQTQDAKLRQQLIKQREKFAEQKKALRQELRNKYKTELISQQTKAKAQAALTAQNTAKRIADIREANRLSKKKAADKRAIAKRRQSVEKITNRLYRKLSKPTDTQHIPQGFRVSVANFLSSLDFEGRDKAGNVKDTKVNAAWQELARECRRIANAEANDADSTYLTIDPDLADRLDELSKTPVRSMNKEQIEELYKAARAIEKAVTDADKVRVNGQMRQATDVARGIISDMAARAKEDRKIFKPTAGAKEFLQWDMMDPVRFADRMGDGFKEVYQNLRDGHDSKIEMWQEAKDYIDSAAAESGLVGEKASEGRIQKALRNLEDSKVKITAGGKGITVSKAQLMSLYNIDRREQGRSHLYGGGIRLPSEDGTIIRTEHNTEYHITEEEVKAAIGNLSKEEIAFANKLQKFLATDAARWGNKVSMEMYGYKKFNEDLYWTLRADHNFTRSEVGQPGETKRNASILSSGFTKQLVEKASNPVYLDSALDVFASHVTEMSSYAAYAVPLNTMNKVLNWQTRHDGNWRSVRKSLTMAYGDRATGYLNNLLAEINGEKIGEQSLNMIQKVTGHAKAAAIGGNLRVVVQQPTSYMRAMDVIPTKYLMMGVFKNSKLTGKTEIEEMYRVVPEARWKNWGYGGDGFKGSNFKELIQGKNLLGRVEDFGSGAAGFADDITWHSMYRACAYWSEGEGHIRGTEDWRQDVRKKFNQVIDQTQVYDSPFKNGQIFKTGGSFGDIFTAFMKEPVTNYNVVMGHIGEINRLNTELRAAKGDKAAVKSIKAMRRKAVGGLVRGSLGVILAGVAAGLVTAPIDIARDKDDEDWLTKLRNALLGESVKDAWSSEDTTGLSKAAAVYGAVVDGSLLDNVNPVGWIPILSSIQDMIDGYDVEVMGVGAIADVGQAATDLTNSINGKPMRNTTRYYTYNLIKKLSVISGIPISNLARAGESLLNAGLMAYEEANGTSASELKFLAEQQYYSPKSSSGQKAFLKTMYEAELEGNNDLAIRIGNFLIQNGDMTYDDVQNQIASLVKADEKFSGLVEDYANAYNSNNYTKLIEIGKKANQLGVSADHIQRAAKSLISGELGDYADTYAAMVVNGETDGLNDLLDAAEAAGLNRFDVIDRGAKKAEKLQAEFNKDSLMEDAEYKANYLYSSLAKAKLRGDSTMAGKITDALTDMGKDEDKISNGTASALKNLAAQQQGYKTYKELTDAGKELDVSSSEYKLLLSEFGDSQYKASSVAEAIISGDTARAEKQIEELKKSEWKDKSADEVSKTVKSAIMSAMRKEMGYESAEEFSEAGAVYDPNSAGVKYVKKLDPDYQFYKYADIAAAYLEGNTAAAQKMANAIVGTHTDSGYERTEDDVWKGVVNNLQDKFNACYNLGKGNESEWRPYVKAMQSLGQNWDKTLSRYRKTSQYKKDSGQS